MIVENTSPVSSASSSPPIHSFIQQQLEVTVALNEGIYEPCPAFASTSCDVSRGSAPI